MYRCFISFLVKNTIFRIGYLNEKRIARNQKSPITEAFERSGRKVGNIELVEGGFE